MVNTLVFYFWVGAGCAFGGIARVALFQWAARQWGTAFPWGTLLVNVSGSFLIGFLATLLSPEGRLETGPHTRVFLLSGMLGGFTTFSAFSLQTLELAKDGEWWRAMGNVAASVGLCLAAVVAGHLVARMLARPISA